MYICIFHLTFSLKVDPAYSYQAFNTQSKWFQEDSSRNNATQLLNKVKQSWCTGCVALKIICCKHIMCTSSPSTFH